MTNHRREKSSAERERNRQYQREYYLKNRERLLQKKRERYQNDPEYREEMRIRDSRRYWFERKQQNQRDLPRLAFSEIEPRAEVLLRDDSGREHRVKLYDTDAIALIVNRSAQTVRNWVSSGVLPSPRLRGWDLGIRGNPILYREDEARAIYNAREHLRRPTNPMHDSAFANKVREAFGILPVMGITVPE